LKWLGQLLGLRRKEMDCDALEGARATAGVWFMVDGDDWFPKG